SSEPSKAAEDCRTPKPVGISDGLGRREASWSAAVLCRFSSPSKETHHRIPMLEHFDFIPICRHRQGISLCMSQNQQTLRTKQIRQMLIVEQLLRHRG